MSGTPSGEQSSDPVVAAGEGLALDRLRRLLQRQLELVHQGSLVAAVELFDQTDRCVREIAVARRPGTAGATEQASARLSESWLGIERLYQDLSMALTAQRTEVSAALNTIRRGKKVLKTYGSSLSSP
jgi:hypothetical protein